MQKLSNLDKKQVNLQTMAIWKNFKHYTRPTTYET